MAEVHFHIWLYKREPDGTIKTMERDEERYVTRRKANYSLEMFKRERSLAGQVLQCVDGAFCQPPPDWVVRGYTLGGPREVTAEYFIDWTTSIRPSRKLAQGLEKLEQYAARYPDQVVRRPHGGGVCSTSVVNIMHDDCDVYVGRGGRGRPASDWGNPFRIGRAVTVNQLREIEDAGQDPGASAGDVISREMAIALYRSLLDARLARGDLRPEDFAPLQGKRLGCFCKPKACHGDVVAEYADRFRGPY